jgi:hypothetical protein
VIVSCEYPNHRVHEPQARTQAQPSAGRTGTGAGKRRAHRRRQAQGAQAQASAGRAGAGKRRARRRRQAQGAQAHMHGHRPHEHTRRHGHSRTRSHGHRPHERTRSQAQPSAGRAGAATDTGRMSATRMHGARSQAQGAQAHSHSHRCTATGTGRTGAAARVRDELDAPAPWLHAPGIRWAASMPILLMMRMETCSVRVVGPAVILQSSGSNIRQSVLKTRKSRTLSRYKKRYVTFCKLFHTFRPPKLVGLVDW